MEEKGWFCQIFLPISIHAVIRRKRENIYVVLIFLTSPSGTLSLAYALNSRKEVIDTFLNIAYRVEF